MRNKLKENHILVKTPAKQGDYHKPYTCTRCGYKHGDGKDSCPAVGKMWTLQRTKSFQKGM